MPAWLMPAGVVVGGLAALGLGIFLAMAVSGPDAVAVASPTPSASPTTAAATVPESSLAAPSSIAPSPTSDAVAIIPNRAIAVVTEEGDQLNLRTAPKRSAESIGQVPAGSDLFIIGTPQPAEGFAWYRVAMLSDDATVGEIGWVATPVQGDPWLAQVAVDCGEPTAAPDLAPLHPLEVLSCFGRDDLTISGVISHPACTGCTDVRIVYEPDWLAYPVSWTFAGTNIAVRFAPAVERQFDPGSSEIGVVLTGHFEDAAAPECRAFVDPAHVGTSPPPQLPATASLVLDCRATFVVTEVVDEGLSAPDVVFY